jgi:hypothetical protein
MKRRRGDRYIWKEGERGEDIRKRRRSKGECERGVSN